MKNSIFPILRFMGFVILISYLTSCYKDRGNYDYTPVNEFSLSGITATTVSQGDTLRLNPMLTEDQPDSLRFDYTWTLELTNEQMIKLTHDSIALVIGHQKMLAYPVPPRILAGNYVVKVEARDRKTGIRRFTSATVQVTMTYQRGYMLLEETVKGGDIVLINGETIHRNLFSDNNGGEYIPVPLHKILSANGLMDNYSKKIIFVTANGFNKELDEQNFKVLRDVQDLFVVPPSEPMAPVFLEALRTRRIYGAFLWSNGRISHVRIGSTNVLQASYDLPIAGDYKLAPYLGFFAGWSYIGFDEKNGRFLNFAYNDSDVLELFTFFNTPTTIFDINHIPMNMVYGSNMFNNRYFTGIFKDKSNKYAIYELILNDFDSGVTPFDTYPIDLNKVPQLDRASHFIASDLLPFLYYTVDNNIYLFDVHNKQSTLFKSFPAGEIISSMEWANKEGSREIAVSTYDGKEGRFYVFIPNSAGTFQEPKWKHEGLGKIVDTHVKFNIQSER